MKPVQLSRSRTYPTTVERAFDLVLPTPLPQIFSRRYAAIPPIKDVRDQEGPWATVGQTRTIVLADRGTMREELTHLDRPRSFGYRISSVTGPMKPLVAGVEGRWSFAEAGTGVEVTWAWTLRPTRVGAPLMPVFGRLWQGYARQALEEIEKLLVP